MNQKDNDIIPNERRSHLWQRFVGIKGRHPPPKGMDTSPEEAVKIAFQKGLQAGYGEGLVDGVDLGMDIGIKASGVGTHTDETLLD